jgi:SAM-dependent methyltransferase
MGFYEAHLLPWIVYWTMGGKALAQVRRRALACARGRVLEIGLGNGHNLPAYPEAVTEVVGVDPSPLAGRLMRKQAARVTFPVTLQLASAEALPFADGSFDTVAMTWTLCTIPDPARALAEMRRVLRPDGRLCFVEHGLSPDPGVARWQQRLDPLQRRIGGGCHLTRKIDDLILAAGFAVDSLDTRYFKGPPTHTYFYQGIAVPGAPADTA